jgi:peptide/nickel transport system substrate-binding protein
MRKATIQGSDSFAAAARRHTKAPLLMALLLSASPAWAQADRVIIALDPPLADTNLFWGGMGERLPAMQALIGNDPVTGEVDNSELASSWEANEDFTEWTIRLHEDAEFQFGWGPVTAADVIHSYELTTAPDSTVVGVDRLRGAEVVALDDHTVVFRYPDPRTDFLFLNAGRGAMVIYSKAQYDAEGMDGYARRPAGTAAYQLVERRVGEGVLLERAPDQWQGIVPDFEELELRWVAEPATKLALLLSGEASISAVPREIQADAVAQGEKVISSGVAAMQTAFLFNGLYMLSDDPAYRSDLSWADIRVRQAINHAIDRQAMIDVLYDGRAEILPRFGMDPRHEGYVPELAERFEEMYGYDPERAKELLAEAGYPDAFPDPVIPIVSAPLTGNPEFPAMAELLQTFLYDVGLQTELREMDYAMLQVMGRAREAYVLSPIRNAPIRPTESALLNFYSLDGTVFGGYEDDTIERLTGELARTIDPGERDRLACEAFTHLFEQYSEIPIASVYADVTVDPTIVEDWTFPGVTTNGVSHWHLIKAAE